MTEENKVYCSKHDTSMGAIDTKDVSDAMEYLKLKLDKDALDVLKSGLFDGTYGFLESIEYYIAKTAIDDFLKKGADYILDKIAKDYDFIEKPTFEELYGEDALILQKKER